MAKKVKSTVKSPGSHSPAKVAQDEQAGGDPRTDSPDQGQQPQDADRRAGDQPESNKARLARGESSRSTDSGPKSKTTPPTKYKNWEKRKVDGPLYGYEVIGEGASIGGEERSVGDRVKLTAAEAEAQTNAGVQLRRVK